MSNVAPAVPESIGIQVRRAVVWRAGSQIVGQIVTWGSTFLVLRLLSPTDYGLMAMTAIVMLFLSLVNGYSFASAVIQRAEVDKQDLRQLLGILILLNLGLAAIQLIAAPFAAAYYREPMVATLLQVQALLHLATPPTVLAYVVLSRGMEFRRQAQVNLVAALLAAVSACAMAFAGWGVWALVWPPLIQAYARAIGMTLVAGTAMLPSFRFTGAGYIMKFGGVVLLGQLFWFVQSQSDIFIVGRRFDAYDLGIYSTALFLAQLFITKVVPPLNEVAFSAYSRIRHVGSGGVAEPFVKSLTIIMYAGLPVFVGFAVTAQPMVQVLLGEQWAETVPLVALLALAMPLKVIIILLGPACNAIDRPEMTLRNSLAGAIILPLCYIAALYWGLIGIAWAWLVGYGLLLLYSARRTFPVIGVDPLAVLKALASPLCASAAMAAVVVIAGKVLPALPPVFELATLVSIGGAVYLGWLLLFSRGELLEIIRLIRGR